MGGTNDKSNIAELTIEEHAEAHRKLYEEHGHWQDKIAWKALSGQITNQEANRLKRIESNKERWADPEFKKRTSKKIGEAMTGLKLGKKQSQYTKDKIAAAKAKDYIITYPDGHEEKIKNLRKFCRENNLAQSALTLVAQGKHKHHKGYKTRYIITKYNEEH